MVEFAAGQRYTGQPVAHLALHFRSRSKTLAAPTSHVSGQLVRDESGAQREDVFRTGLATTGGALCGRMLTAVA